MSLAVLVPVLNRPHRVGPLLDSLFATVSAPHVVFICDHNDEQEIRTIMQDGRAEAPVCLNGNYAEKIHTGVALTDTPLIFTGADDLEFRPGWLAAAEAHIDAGAQVVGVNDLIPRRREHATHFLMTREYAKRPTIDGEPGPFFQGYSHSFTDDELIATAKHRGVYAYAEDSVVEHLHPMVRKAPDDETYRRGMAQFRLDRRRFQRRSSRLWAA